MALVIGKKETRKVRINFDEAGDLDKFTRHTADVEFKILAIDEVKEIEALGQKENEAYDQDALVSKIFDSIVSIEGLKDEAGKELLYSDEVRDALINTLWIRYPIMIEFWNVQSGTLSPKAYKQAKLKN